MVAEEGGQSNDRLRHCGALTMVTQRSVRFQGRRADSGEMAVRGFVTRDSTLSTHVLSFTDRRSAARKRGCGNFTVPTHNVGPLAGVVYQLEERR